MKAKLFLAAMLLMVGANVMADEYQYLTITYSDTERSISLPIIQQIVVVGQQQPRDRATTLS